MGVEGAGTRLEPSAVLEGVGNHSSVLAICVSPESVRFSFSKEDDRQSKTSDGPLWPPCGNTHTHTHLHKYKARYVTVITKQKSIY